MKLIGRLNESFQPDSRYINIDFSFDRYNIGFHANEFLSKLNPDEEYLITIEPKQAVRTYRQNSYLWALIGEMCRNYNSPRHDEWEMYCWLLAEAKAKYIYVQVPSEAVESLKSSVRALEVIRYTEGPKGKLAVCRVFEGSSKMSKKEMNVLIDKTLEVAEELDIDTSVYREVLK